MNEIAVVNFLDCINTRRIYACSGHLKRFTESFPSSIWQVGKSFSLLFGQVIAIFVISVRLIKSLTPGGTGLSPNAIYKMRVLRCFYSKVYTISFYISFQAMNEVPTRPAPTDRHEWKAPKSTKACLRLK